MVAEKALKCFYYYYLSTVFINCCKFCWDEAWQVITGVGVYKRK